MLRKWRSDVVFVAGFGSGRIGKLARLEELPLNERRMVMGLDCSVFAERRVAIVSTAALNLRTDAVFHPGFTDYRSIPGDVTPGDVMMSHLPA